MKRPELWKLEGNVGEIQVRATALLSKIFLANLPLLFNGSDQSADSEELWLLLVRNMLQFLDAPLTSNKADLQLLRESIPETIKNMLLVMASTGVLRPPQSGEHVILWDSTWRLLDPVLMRAKAEITELAKPEVTQITISTEVVKSDGKLDATLENSDEQMIPAIVESESKSPIESESKSPIEITPAESPPRETNTFDV